MLKRRPLIPRMWKLIETGNIYLINCQFYDVNSLIQGLKYIGFTDEKELSFEEYLENIKDSLQNNKVHNHNYIEVLVVFLFSSQHFCNLFIMLIWPFLTVLILIKTVSSPMMSG